MVELEKLPQNEISRNQRHLLKRDQKTEQEVNKRGYGPMCSCVRVAIDVITRTNHQVYGQMYFQITRKDSLTIKAA